MKKSTSIGWSFTLWKFSLLYVTSVFLRRCRAPLAITALSILLPAISLAQQIKLEQGHNGGVGRPVLNPVSWTEGNCYDENAHFIEGQSIPYRVTISNVSPGNHFLIVEWDIRKDGKTAIDYITDVQRISETVNPLRGLSGSYGAPSYLSIPAPQRNVSVTGYDGTQQQPLFSFNQLPASQKRITIYNGTPVSASYLSEGDPSRTYSTTKLKIEFKVTGYSSKNIVLAWGGHIASRLDWGAANAPYDNNSSPYRTRVTTFDGKDCFNLDRSLRNSAVSFVPSCEILGSKTFCEEISYGYTAKTNAPNPIINGR